jgi:hypothetical protein
MNFLPDFELQPNINNSLVRAEEVLEILRAQPRLLSLAILHDRVERGNCHKKRKMALVKTVPVRPLRKS